MILKPPKGAMLNRGHPYARGLVGLWLMNEGGGNTVADLSGNGNTGSLVAAPLFVGGKFGPALSFNGLNNGNGNRVDIGDLNNATEGITALSILLWARTPLTACPYTQYLINKTSGADTFRIWWGTNESVFYDVYNDSAQSGQGAYTDAFESDSEYHQCVGVYNGTDVRMYYDSKIGSNIGALTGLTRSDAGIARIGGLSGYNAWNGQIDHVMIYNRALSATEILNLYRNPFCMFEVDL